jgi:hypothetical protein
MKRMLSGLGMLLLSAGLTHAQTGANIGRPQLYETQSLPISSALIESGQQDPIKDLPDAPIPILPQKQDGPMPCPSGVGLPCSLLGGRLYFSDPSHMTQHDRTWLDAFKNPMMLGGLAVNAAAAVWDLRATRACIDNHTCRERNPIMGQSLAQQVTVGAGLGAFFYYGAVRMKQRGRGNTALFLLAASTGIHILLATYGHPSIAKR